MKPLRPVYLIIALPLILALPMRSIDDSRYLNRLTRNARLSESYGRLPLSFEANHGQAANGVKFISRGSGYSLSLTATGSVLKLRQPDSPVLRMTLVGADPAASALGREVLPGKSHYYIGNDPKNWRTDVSTYAKVEYGQVWPGVDLVYYGNQRQLEYDFIVAPGTNPHSISFTFDGADQVNLDAEGNLVVHIAGGEIAMQKPFIYQEVDGARREIVGRYQISNPQPATLNPVVGFDVGEYDAGKPLVIDPVLTYSTYLGGGSSEEARDIDVDSEGNAYVTGWTFSTNFPTANPAQNTGTGLDVFVTKLNPTGTALLYSTYLGGNDATPTNLSPEFAFGIAVDSQGSAYVVGGTQARNFPTTPGAFNRTCTLATNGTCDDAFVTKLNPSGNGLVYSTYLGGANPDEGTSIAVDPQGNAYVTGSTSSSNFPVTTGAFDTSFNGRNDYFVTKLNPTGSALSYSTYLGGTLDESGDSDIVVDAQGSAYVTGTTESPNYPTTQGAFDTSCGTDGQCNPITGNSRSDIAVTRLNPGGTALLYSTFLGGSGADVGWAISIDAAGNAYVGGQGIPNNFPTTPGAYKTTATDRDGFVAKLNPAGAALVYSTFLTGLNPFLTVYDIAVDLAGNAHVTGAIATNMLPVVNPIQGTPGGGFEAFVVKLNAAGSAPVYSTYLGGSGPDYGYGIAVDAAGAAYVTGTTGSTNFPTMSPLQAARNAGNDVFITKILDSAPSPPHIVLDKTKLDIEGETGGDNPPEQTVTLTNTGGSTLDWQANVTTTKGGDWLSVTPASRSLAPNESVTLTVTFDDFALLPDRYEGSLSVTALNADNSPQQVAVTLDVYCPGEDLRGTSRAGQICNDVLTISGEMPPNNTVVSATELGAGGIKAQVSHLLVSRPRADLVLRVFDEQGNRRGSSQIFSFDRPTPPPSIIPSREMIIPGGNIDLSPIGGVNPQILTVYALLIDPLTSNIIKRSNEVYYQLQGGKVTMSRTRINDQDAPNGSILPTTGTIRFSCDLEYQLFDAGFGEIRLRAFNATDGVTIGTSQVRLATGGGQKFQIVDFSFSFQNRDLADINIIAELFNSESPPRLMGSDLVSYLVKLEIEPGVYINSQFHAIHPGPFLGGRVRQEDFAIRVKSELPPIRNNAVVLLLEKLADGTLVRGPRGVTITQREGPPRPVWDLHVDGLVIPDDVDRWEIQLSVFLQNGTNLISDPIIIPINRIRIESNLIKVGFFVEYDTPTIFSTTLKYNALGSGTYRIEPLVEFESATGQKVFTTYPGEDVPAGNGVTRVSMPLIVIPPGTKFLRLGFRLKTAVCGSKLSELLLCSAISKTLTYRNFRLSPYTIPPGVGTVIRLQGVDVKPVQILINAGGNLIKRGISHWGTSKIDSLINAPRTEFTNAASPLPSHLSQTFDPSIYFRNLVSLNTVWQFDTPVPPDSGFIADLTFYYHPSDFPDDPNFSEANLQVVALDPASGRIERLQTTLDLAAKTATARVNGLAPFYTLGVFGPFSSRKFNLPLLSSEEGLENTLVFLNPGSSSLTVSAQGYESSGALLSGFGVEPAAAVTLTAGQQLVRTVSELFHLDPLTLGALGLNGWVEARSDRPFITGYQMFGSGTRRDVLDMSPLRAASHVLTDVVCETNETTEIHLANGANIENGVLIELYSANGTRVAFTEELLSPKGRFAGRIEDIFPNITKPFSGYLLVLGDTDLSAAGLSVSSAEIAALNARPLQSGTFPTKIYGAYVITNGSNLTTRLNLVNPTANAANLSLRLVGLTGSDLAAPVNLMLAAGQQSQREIRALFNLGSNVNLSGSLIIDSSTTGIVGDLSYRDPSGTTSFRASLPLAAELGKSFAFAHVDNRVGNFTRFTVLNADIQATSVTIKVHRADGAQTGTANVLIAAQGSYSGLLSDLVPASAGQNGGYFIITADRPVVAGAVFGASSGETLSALPVQVVEEPGIAIPHLAATTGTNLTIPVTVGDLTGRGIIAYDFDVVYDPAVLAPQSPAFTSADTLSSAFTVSANVAMPGRLRVSAFGNTALVGAGTLLNLKFNITGAAGSGASLALDRFFLNDDPETALVRGSVTVARSAATVSAASYAPMTVAGESIAAVFGASLATEIQVAETLPLPTELAGTIVKIKDSAGIERLAPLFFVSDGQINLQIPPGTVNGTATVTVRSGNGAISIGSIQIARTAPGLFAANSDGQGLAAAQIFRLKANGAQSFEPIAQFDAALGRFVPIPIDLGPESDQVFLVLFGTGIRHRGDISGVSATLGGATASVLFAGPQGGFVGLDQVNLPLSRSLIGRGEVIVTLNVDGTMANSVRVTMK